MQEEFFALPEKESAAVSLRIGATCSSAGKTVPAGIERQLVELTMVDLQLAQRRCSRMNNQFSLIVHPFGNKPVSMTAPVAREARQESLSP